MPGSKALATLTTAQASGNAGNWAAYAAALPAALAAPRPAAMVGWLTAAWAIPAVAAAAAGRPVDRFGPRVTGAAAWSLAAAAEVVAAVARPGVPGLVIVLAVASLGATCGVAAGEAAPTWIPGASQTTAGAWLVVSTNLPLAVGPVGATTLTLNAGTRAAWEFTAALSAAAALLSLLVPARRPGVAGTIPAGPRCGAAGVRGPWPPAAERVAGLTVPAPARRALEVTAAVYLAVGVITVAESLYVTGVLHRSLAVYGWLLSVQAGAGVLTAAATAWWPAVITARRAMAVAMLTLAGGAGLYLGTVRIDCAFAGAAAFGAGMALLRQSCRTILVRALPPSGHGRILSWWETAQCAGSAAPALAAGLLISWYGLHAVLAGTCGFVAVCSLAGRRPALDARAWAWREFGHLTAAATALAAAAAVTLAAYPSLHPPLPGVAPTYAVPQPAVPGIRPGTHPGAP